MSEHDQCEQPEARPERSGAVAAAEPETAPAGEPASNPRAGREPEASAPLDADDTGVESPPDPSTEEAPDPFAEMEARLRRAEERLQASVALRQDALKWVRRLLKDEAFRSPDKLGRLLREAHGKFDEEARRKAGLGKLLQRLARWREELPRLSMARLERELAREARQRGIRLRVVRERPLLAVRLFPFEVELDARRGEARLRFAEETLATTALEAKRVLAEREALLRDLADDFDPERFFEALLTAYRQALVARGERMGAPVELREVLPLLALQMQAEGFRRSLDPKGWRPYGRGALAFHLWLLQRSGRVRQRGLWLQVGVATGVSGRDRKRTLRLEDGDGHGERKLTLHFAPAPQTEIEPGAQPEPGGAPPDEAEPAPDRAPEAPPAGDDPETPGEAGNTEQPTAREEEDR